MATLEDVLITDELQRRPHRQPDYGRENQALLALADRMAASPTTVLQDLVETALKLCQADSAGISILEQNQSGQVFRWHAIAGEFAHNLYGTMERAHSPCGKVLDRNAILLLDRPHRYFSVLEAADPPIVEILLVPFYTGEECIGTVWLLAHTQDCKFDGEDARLLTSLSRFAGAALQMTKALEQAERGRRASQSLEQRTIDLSAANEALRSEAEVRQRAEDELRKSEVLYRALAANLPNGAAFVVDRDLRYRLAEGQALHTAGFTAADLEGRTVREALPTEIADRYELHYRQALAGEPFQWEHFDHGCHFISHGVPLRYDSGEIYAVLAVSYDITSRKQAEEALKASEERYRMMVNEVKDYAIFMIDLQNRIRTWNIGAEQILRYTEEEVIGASGEIVFTPEDREQGAPQQELETARREGRAEDERWHIRKDGDRFWGSGVMTSLWNPDGTLHGYVKLMRDRTEQKLSEEERARVLQAEKKARQQAEEVNRMREEFLATLSHELRTPISAVVGWARLLRKAILSEEEKVGAYEVIERNSMIQAKMIEDLLDSSRVILGKLRLDLGQIDLKVVVAAAIESIRPTAQAKGVGLSISSDPQVGFVPGDAERLQQVMLNLLSNAVKFTPTGGRVEVRLRKNETSARIEVIDTGQGISAEFLPYVFDAFRQADASPSREHGGLGLGLAIVQRLVKLHGGSVSVQSAGEGQGTTFTVELPLVANSTGDVQMHENESQTSLRCPASLTERKILLVEDQADMRHMVTTILSICGCTVTSLSNAREGLEQLAADEFHLIITDIGMPNEDGFYLLDQATRILTQRGRRVPVVALTAFASNEDRQRILSAGFAAHITKPVDPQSLVEVLDEVLRRDQ